MMEVRTIEVTSDHAWVDVIMPSGDTITLRVDECPSDPTGRRAWLQVEGTTVRETLYEGRAGS
jgi:hypothetical protein